MGNKYFRIPGFLLGVLFVLHGFFTIIVGTPGEGSGIGSIISSIGLGAIFIFYALTGYSSIYKYFKERTAK